MNATLTPQATAELTTLLATCSFLTAGAKLTTETPVGRGGTQELMDAGLIELVKDDGLTSTYELTELGAAYKPSRPAVHKVRITDRTIYVNGERIGRIDGTRSEVWVMGEVAGNPHAFVARFKYCQPGKKARAFIKAMFARLTMPEYLGLLAKAHSPAAVARAIGVSDY